jgi:hypothetical protein
VLNSRVTYTFTPKLHRCARSIIPISTPEHQREVQVEVPSGSDFFIVYSDGRYGARGFPRMETRTFTVKPTRFFRSELLPADELQLLEQDGLAWAPVACTSRLILMNAVPCRC